MVNDCRFISWMSDMIQLWSLCRGTLARKKMFVNSMTWDFLDRIGKDLTANRHGMAHRSSKKWLLFWYDQRRRLTDGLFLELVLGAFPSETPSVSSTENSSGRSLLLLGSSTVFRYAIKECEGRDDAIDAKITPVRGNGIPTSKFRRSALSQLKPAPSHHIDYAQHRRSPCPRTRRSFACASCTSLFGETMDRQLW